MNQTMSRNKMFIAIIVILSLLIALVAVIANGCNSNNNVIEIVEDVVGEIEEEPEIIEETPIIAENIYDEECDCDCEPYSLIDDIVERVEAVDWEGLGASALEHGSNLFGAASEWLDNVGGHNQPDLLEVTVVYIVDGDTIDVLFNGETYRIRFIGVDAPDRGEPGFDEATQFVREMIYGRIIWLESDGNDTDVHGRFRRYIWTEQPTNVNCESEIRTKMLNAILLTEGHAEVMIIENVRHEYLFRGLCTFN